MRTDIKAKLRSRKGSVKTIEQFVAELLLRSDIWPRVRLGRLLYIDFITRREASIRRSQRGNNWATPQSFSLPLGLRPSHLLIVRGNCEALGDRGGTIPWLLSTITYALLYTPRPVVLWLLSFATWLLAITSVTVKITKKFRIYKKSLEIVIKLFDITVCLLYTVPVAQQKTILFDIFHCFVIAKLQTCVAFVPTTTQIYCICCPLWLSREMRHIL